MTATISEAKRAIRNIPTSVLFTEPQLMWFVKDWWKIQDEKSKKLWVDSETVQKALEKMMGLRNPYIFQSVNDEGEKVYWRDAAAFSEN